MRRLGIVAVAAIVGLGVAPVGDAAVTYFFDSQGFDAVGNGESGTLTDADGSWNVTGRGTSLSGPFVGIRLGFSPDDPAEDPWVLEFLNANDSELAVGAYTDLGRMSDGTKARMEIYNPPDTCTGDDEPENEFTVSDVEYDLYGRPIRFAATFTLRCGTGRSPLIGSIDFAFDGNRGAPGFSDGNLLVTLDSILYEYTTGGNQVQVLPIGRGPSPPLFFGLDRRTFEPARDLEMSEGVLHLFNEQSNLLSPSFSDELSRLSTLYPSGTWRHDEFDSDWNQGNDLDSGIGLVFPFVFAVDAPVGGDARGIIRFDTDSNFAAERFESGEWYKDVVGGLDGKLYALRTNRTTVEIFDPTTLAYLGTTTLDVGVNAIAVNADGTIFGVGGISEVTIYDFGQAGTTQNSLDLDASLPFGITMMDVDVSSTGQMAIGLSEIGSTNRDGEIILSDETLGSWTLVTIDPSPSEAITYVTFVVPIVPVFADGFESGDLSAWSSSSP